LTLTIVAAFLTRWRHPNLRALASKKLPLARPHSLNTTEGCRGGIQARLGTSMKLNPCDNRVTR